MKGAIALVARSSSGVGHHNRLVLRRVRIVPEVFATKGNVAAYAERLDAQPLPEARVIRLGDMTVKEVWLAPDGRLYFLPPEGGGGTIHALSLGESGLVYGIERAVSYTDQALDSVKSLCCQMDVLRDLGRARVAYGREEGEDEGDVRLAYSAAISDGHIRLARALERVYGGSTPAADRDAIVAELDRLDHEHAPDLDHYLASTFPPQEVNA